MIVYVFGVQFAVSVMFPYVFATIVITAPEIVGKFAECVLFVHAIVQLAKSYAVRVGAVRFIV